MIATGAGKEESEEFSDSELQFCKKSVEGWG